MALLLEVTRIPTFEHRVQEKDASRWRQHDLCGPGVFEQIGRSLISPYMIKKEVYAMINLVAPFDSLLTT